MAFQVIFNICIDLYFKLVQMHKQVYHWIHSKFCFDYSFIISKPWNNGYSLAILIWWNLNSNVTNLVASHHTTAAHHPWTTTPIIHCTTTHTFPATIAPITQLSPITNQPWLSCHTCTSFTHPHISSTLPYTRCKVLFCPGWHSERFPCILLPCVYLDCLYYSDHLPSWPCLPCDILSVCRLPRP